MTEVLRTPDERFVDLPGFLYEAVYIEDLKGFEGMRKSGDIIPIS